MAQGELDEQPWQRAAAYVVCRDGDGRVLLTHLHLPGQWAHRSWTLPGGGMDWGEQPADTALRELQEETGLSASLGRLLGVWSQWIDGHQAITGTPGHALAVIFEATPTSGELLTEFPPGSTDGAAWFAVDEIAALRRVPLVDAALALLAEQPPDEV
jgi:ADP-ribose pyrophosphatase YjhB (NUDIX family)